MARPNEIFGYRPNEYGVWHRATSIGRNGWIDTEEAKLLSMADIDCAYWCEYEHAYGKRLLGLVETTKYARHFNKDGSLLRDIAMRMYGNVFAAVVYYDSSDKLNTYVNGAQTSAKDIDRFAWQWVYPYQNTPPIYWIPPDSYARWLVRVRKWARTGCW